MAETKELANFYYISLTDKGMVRSRNEDYLGYFDTVNGHIFVVCDGIGGLPCGDKAAQTVVNSVKFFFSNFYYRDVHKALEDALDYAQNRMAEEARTDRECAGMGCTVVLALVRYNKVYYAHMGDSRIYFMHNRKLQQLTQDDSYVQQLVNEGKISQQEAENHPRKNELVRAMGMTKTAHFASSYFPFRRRFAFALYRRALQYGEFARYSNNSRQTWIYRKQRYGIDEKRN